MPAISQGAIDYFYPMFRRLTWLFFCFLCYSCEKELNIQPNDPGEVLTVDAFIENEQAPRVILTRSFKYFNTISIADVENAFISGAIVKLTDGTTTQELKEYTIPFAAGNIKYYSTDSGLGNNQLLGKLNNTYHLAIQTGGKTYQASTRIPPISRTIDSLWWKPAPENKDTNKVVLFGRFTDPKGLGNYIRYYTSRNDSVFLPGLNSAFDDVIIDGTTYEIQVDRGVNRNLPLDFDEYGFFLKGDTVSLKLSNIDKATFDFWRTWEQNQSSQGNPFSVPVKVLGNISNGALGYFGGYASQVKKLVIPK